MNKKLEPGDRYAPLLTKLSRIMRLVILMLVLGINSLSAVTSYSQSTKITLKISDTRIEEVLNQIESKSEFYFLFNQKLIDIDRRVTLNAENAKISDVLNEIFSGTDVKYQVIDRQIILTTSEVTQNQQQNTKKISGKVTDSTGGSLPGVSVVVKGTTAGVITDNNGSYYVGGRFEYNLVVNGSTTLTNDGSDTDFFIAKYGSSNCVLATDIPLIKGKAVLYPNPVHDKLTIDVAKNTHYSIYDLLGKLVQEGELTEIDKVIDVAGIAQGQYVVKMVNADGDSESVKLVKQ